MEFDLPKADAPMRHLLRNRGIRLIWPSFRPGMRNSTRNVNRGQKLLKCRFARLARPLKSASALKPNNIDSYCSTRYITALSDCVCIIARLRDDLPAYFSRSSFEIIEIQQLKANRVRIGLE